MNINELLAAYNRIVIPRIQRDYAQGRQDSRTKEIRSNLLNDLFSMKNVSFNMIFGESDDGRNFIPIDGQQRLTLLFLLALYGHKKVDKADMGLESEWIPVVLEHGSNCAVNVMCIGRHP